MRWAIWGREILRVGGGLVKVMMDGTYTGVVLRLRRGDEMLYWDGVSE